MTIPAYERRASAGQNWLLGAIRENQSDTFAVPVAAYRREGNLFPEPSRSQGENEGVASLGQDRALRKAISDTRAHVIQLEVLSLLGLVNAALLWIAIVPEYTRIHALTNRLPFLLLALLPFFIRVRNPSSRLRDGVMWGLAGAGTGGTIGSAGGPVFTLVGAGLGLIAGVSYSLVDGRPSAITQGAARKYLAEQVARNPGLSLSMIENATAGTKSTLPAEQRIEMFDVDGVPHCLKSDAEKWLRSKCWRVPA